jgi:Tfp pilus assembly protein FimT
MNQPMKLQKRSGVTLVEALMVIMVLAAAATIGAFRASPNQGISQEIEATAELIGQTLRVARNLSIQKQTDVVVTHRFQAASRVGGQTKPAHWVMETREMPGPMPRLVQRTGTVRAPMQMNVSISSAIELQGDFETVTFHADGSTDRSALWTVTSQDRNRRGTHDVRLQLDPVTGYYQTSRVNGR